MLVLDFQDEALEEHGVVVEHCGGRGLQGGLVVFEKKKEWSSFNRNYLSAYQFEFRYFIEVTNLDNMPLF